MLKTVYFKVKKNLETYQIVLFLVHRLIEELELRGLQGLIFIKKSVNKEFKFDEYWICENNEN